MSDDRARFGFALLCALLMVAIGMGAVWEIARFRRSVREESAKAAIGEAAADAGGLVSTRQLRLRLLSAALWMAVLGALAYAVTVLWPLEGRSLQGKAQVSRFATVVGGALCLMLVAFALLVYDVIQVARQQRLQTARLHQSFADMARSEAARLHEMQRQKARGGASDSATGGVSGGQMEDAPPTDAAQSVPHDTPPDAHPNETPPKL